jgi:hypothetical protein
MEPSKAAMLPLEYGGIRDEMTVTYVSHDWEELASLLYDPAEFFRLAEPCWPQEPPEPCVKKTYPWRLLTPTTIVLEYAAKSVTRAARLLVLTAGKRVSEDKDEGSGSSLQEEPIPIRVIRPAEDHGLKEDKAFLQLEHLTRWLYEEFPEGGFVAEFAILTGTLFVNYIPNPNTSQSNKTRQRFRGTFTNSSMVTMGITYTRDRIDYTIGSMHVDIGSSALHRTQFVHDLLEDSGKALSWAANAHEGGFRLGKAYLKKKGEVIKPVPCALHEPLKFGMRLNDFPSVVIEHGSVAAAVRDLDQCAVCTESTVLLVDGTYMVDGVIVKCYTAPATPGP